MILLVLRNYLQQHGQANLRDLVQHFGAEPETLRAMLGHLIRKGQVRVADLPNGGQCGGCTQCDPLTLEVYYWQNAEISTPVPEQIIRFAHRRH